jgi:hypothetical protein
MTTKQKRTEYQYTTDSLLDRLIDGKIVDTGEIFDRLVLSQQVSLVLPLPAKQSPKRVR